MSSTSLKTVQAFPIKRAMIACFNYTLLLTLIIVIVNYFEYAAIPATQLTALTIFAPIIAMGLYAVIITDINLKFKESSLTLTSIILCSLWGGSILLIMPEVRPIILMLFFPAFLFSVLYFDKKQYFKLFKFVIFLYSIVIISEVFWLRPELNLTYELVVFSCFSFVLGCFTYFCRKFSDIKNQLPQQNITNDLTKQYNRRYTLQTLQFMHNYCERYNDTYALIILDIDHFKAINEQFGHSIGDQVLTKFSKEISSSLRSADVLFSAHSNSHEQLIKQDPMFARFAEEELIILLPGVNKELAKQCISRLQNAVSNIDFFPKMAIKLTFSVGIASFEHKKDLKEIINLADKALYLAKNKGYNYFRTARG